MVPAFHSLTVRIISKKMNEDYIKSLLYNTFIITEQPKMTRDDILTWLLNYKELEPFAEHYRQIYTMYNQMYNQYHRRAVVRSQEPETTMSFPFRSKLKDFFELRDKGLITSNVQFTKEKPEPNPKKLKKEYMRPSFSPHPYSWEIDHLQYKNEIRYLIAININTRYLYAILVQNKSAQETRRALEYLVSEENDRFNHPVVSVRGDGDKGFENVRRYFPQINFYLSSSKYTYHNKIVDAAIRTLRNAMNDDEMWNGQHDDLVQQLVYYYNFTTHRTIKMKPIDMHNDIDAEWKYIRQKTEELDEVKERQTRKQFFRYKPNDTLKLHLDYSKSPERFSKRRRQFDTEGKFVDYVNGNCAVQMKDGKIIEVPIYFTFKK